MKEHTNKKSLYNRYGVDTNNLQKDLWYTVVVRKNGRDRGLGFMPYDHRNENGIAIFRHSGKLYEVRDNDIVGEGPPSEYRTLNRGD